jgi:hypothetical protein
MFCPKCGGDNDIGLSFCRHCGQSLKAVSLAVDGRADQSIANFQKAGDSLISGLVTFAIFFVLAVIAYIAFGIWPAAIDLLLGLTFSIPQILKGVSNHQKAQEILKAETPLITTPSPMSLPQGRTTDSMDQAQNSPSVTEHTTFHLERPDSRQ